jgi:hypothetical protein
MARMRRGQLPISSTTISLIGTLSITEGQKSHQENDPQAGGLQPSRCTDRQGSHRELLGCTCAEYHNAAVRNLKVRRVAHQHIVC